MEGVVAIIILVGSFIFWHIKKRCVYDKRLLNKTGIVSHKILYKGSGIIKLSKGQLFFTAREKNGKFLMPNTPIKIVEVCKNYVVVEVHKKL